MPTLVPTDATMVHRVVVQLLGLAVVATGVALTIRAELGVAPYDVVTTGMHERLDIPIGVAAILLPLVFLLLGRALGGRVGVGTVLAVALVGPVLGMVLDLLPEIEALVPRLGLYGLGFLGIASGIVLVIIPDLGAGPAEVLMLAITGRGVPLAPARTGIELVCVAIGFAMGGQVGVGTLVFAALIGPVLRRLLTWVGYDDTEAAKRSDTAAPGA